MSRSHFKECRQNEVVTERSPGKCAPDLSQTAGPACFRGTIGGQATTIVALHCVSSSLVGAVLLSGAVAFAASPAPPDLSAAPVASFALVIGSNAPGPG